MDSFKSMRLIVVALIFSLCSLTLKSQIIITAVNISPPNVKINDYLNLMVSNTSSEAYELYFKILVSNSAGEIVAEGVTSAVTISPFYNGHFTGLNYQRINYMNNPNAIVMRSSGGVFPPGTYNVKVLALNKKTHKEEASEQIQTVIELMNPPILVTPFDHEELLQLYPIFTWLPPSPVSPQADLSYEITIVELRSGQNAQTAIISNPPVFRQNNLRSLRLNYPVYGSAFDRNKTYAWQIKAYIENFFIGKSDVWVYNFKNETISQPQRINIDQSYILMKKGGETGVYLAVSSVKFKFMEEYVPGTLDYGFYDSKNSSVVVSNTNQIMKSTGPNLYEIDLYEELTFVSGQYYTLEIITEKKEKFRIRFKYLRSENNEE